MTDSDEEVDEEEEEDDDEDGSPIPFDPMRSFLGENDEHILFSERAKLYHFDLSINQLAQRGIGELMIVQHKLTNLCRILMLADDELDICVNHPLTRQLELKPHPGIPYAYIWSVLDFARGEAKYETFCVKFHSDEQGRKFVRIFDEFKETLPSLNEDFDLMSLNFSLYENQAPSKGRQDEPSSNESTRKNRPSHSVEYHLIV